MAATVSLHRDNRDEKIKGVVARVAIPMPVRGVDKLIDYLEKGYGVELFMYQEGEWIVFTTEKI